MAYAVDITPPRTPESEVRAGRIKPATFHYADKFDALGAARLANKRGGVAWRMEGDDGTLLHRHEIIETVEKLGHELIGRPKVY